MAKLSTQRKSIGGAVTSLFVLAAFLVPAAPASATPPRGVGDVTDAVVYGDGAPLGEVIEALRNEDDAVSAVALPFPINFFGTSYSALCVSTNGGVYPLTTLPVTVPVEDEDDDEGEDACEDDYDETLENLALSSEAPIIAPLAADIDLENHPIVDGVEVLDDGFGETAQVYVGSTSIDGKDAIALTWYRVQMYDGDNDEALTNTFQVVLIKNATANGTTAGYDFTIQFNYGSIQDNESGYQYESEDNDSDDNDNDNNSDEEEEPYYWGVGWASFVPATEEEENDDNEDNDDGHSDAYELFPTTPRDFLIDGAASALTGNSLNTDVTGRYTFSMVGGSTVGFGVPVMDGSGEVEPQPNAGVAPTITSALAPAGVVDAAYSHTVTATGDAPVVFTVSAGTLPAGLELNPTSGEISGTPTAAGSSTFTIRATNPAGFVTQESTVEITAPEVPVVTDPVIGVILGAAVGDAAANALIAVAADGLAPESAWDLTMYSTPTVLGSGITSSTGGFYEFATLPAVVEPGAHALVVSGIAPAGGTVTGRAWFSVLANGTIGAISFVGPIVIDDAGTPATPGVITPAATPSATPTATPVTSALASTGTDLGVPLGIAGALMLLGLLATVVRRRIAHRN